MARTLITITAAEKNAAADITSVDVDLTNSHYLDLSDSDAAKIALVFNGSTADMDVSILAGDFSDASLGDLDFTIGDGEKKVVAFESARFKDDDGYVLIDVSSTGSADGTIEAIELPL